MLSPRGHAFLHLGLDINQVVSCVGVLWLRLRAYRPLEKGWFNLKFFPMKHWLWAVALGVITFPIVKWSAGISLEWFPCNTDLWGPDFFDQSVASGDPVTNAVYFGVVSAIAPSWEEILFRGFLLPSLTKFFPRWVAVVLSSLIFAAAHFSLHRVLPLMLLGIVLAVLYFWTKNLLPCIMVHSLWNALVFLQYAYRGPGFDLFPWAWLELL
eukprot:jgi/Botrbrau1/21385/Bobra.0216s0006.1